MRRRSAIPAFLTTLLLATAGQAETLNLLIWESYIDQAILDRWTAITGVGIHQVYYDSGDTRDEVLADPNSIVDLVVTGENGAALFGRKGVLEAVDESNVASLRDYDESWRTRCSNRGLPYLWGTMGILYRSDMLPEPPTSWRDLMQPAPALHKHVAMYDDHNEAFVAPLMLLGQSINTNEPETLKIAFNMMKEQAPSVLTYEYVISSIQNQAIGKDIHLALGYSGDQHVLNEKAGTPDVWRYVVPKEGTLSWLDCMSVVAKSPNKARALAFLDYIGSPGSAAANAQALNMPTPSKAAFALLPDAIRADQAIYPSPDILAKSQYQQELSTTSVQLRRRIISTLANFQ
ncbi:Spermidine/putrescine-binding periplasmic protein [Ensifer sp. M14]|uniref:ABC transporter substrate-binding protein n=1 Tax=Ensifer sp. M14 TaxID=2203782 RepID=UPI000E1D1A7E|nr:spermidine/putrescine ABC transporter substrate-binding protein [Ensifer sp. M14]RDL52681.1 Spermidine/putrescine-binding periplasmic protein [Ensifer sp. M14]